MKILILTHTKGHAPEQKMKQPTQPQYAYEKARAARIAAVQAFFQIQSNEQSVQDVYQEFITFRFSSGHYPYPPDPILFKNLLEKSVDRQKDFRSLIEENLHPKWSYPHLDPVLKAILYISLTELLENLSSVPAPVLISEYVDITKGFLSGEEPKFVNRLLDHVAQGLGYPMKPQASPPA